MTSHGTAHHLERVATVMRPHAAMTMAKIALLVVSILLNHDLAMAAATPLAHADAVSGLHESHNGHQHGVAVDAQTVEVQSACGAVEAVRAPDRAAPDTDAATTATPVTWPSLAVQCTVSAPDAPEPGIPPDRSRALLQVFLI